MRLLWSRQAHADRRAIRDFIAQDNPVAAMALDSRLAEQAALLLVQPERGRLGRVASTREWVAHRNYVLVYDLTDDALRILRVLHAGQQWP